MSAMLARLSAESKTRPDASIRRALLGRGVFIVVLDAGFTPAGLAISDHDRLATGPMQQQLALETAPQRGQLLARHDRELCAQLQTESIFVDPANLFRPAISLCRIRGLPSTGLNEQTVDSALAGQQGRRFFCWLGARLRSREKIRGFGVAGVHFRTDETFYQWLLAALGWSCRPGWPD